MVSMAPSPMFYRLRPPPRLPPLGGGTDTAGESFPEIASVYIPPPIGWYKPREMPHIVCSHNHRIVVCSSQHGLRGQDHIPIQGFVIRRRASLPTCVSPTLCSLTHHCGGER
jgi:hypothetical protein